MISRREVFVRKYPFWLYRSAGRDAVPGTGLHLLGCL